MDHRLIEGMMVAIAPVIREHLQAGVERATGPLLDTIRALETRLGVVEKKEPIHGEKGDEGKAGEKGEAGPQGPPGEKGDRGEPGQPGDPGSPGEKGVDGWNGSDGKDGRDGIDGKDADPELIKQMVFEEVSKIPPPLNGRDADPVEIASLLVPEVRQAVSGEIQAAVAALPKPQDGKDADPAVIQRMITEAVSEAVERAVTALPQPRDGVGVAGAVIDRSGVLVLTLSDGSTKELGVVVGKDADRQEIAAVIADEVAKFPKPKDGKDGLGFDDIEAIDEEREYGLRFRKDDNIKDLRFNKPTLKDFDAGVWKEGSYKKGDAVTWEGSWHIAQCDTDEKPTASRHWRIAAKKGGNGSSVYELARKHGFKGTEREWLASLKGEPGPEGKPGRDGKLY